jgi:hypothetical protein
MTNKVVLKGKSVVEMFLLIMKTNKNVSYGWERSNSKGKNDGIKGKV